MIHNDIRADHIVLGKDGIAKLAGFRQMAWLNRDGEYLQSVFSRVSGKLGLNNEIILVRVDSLFYFFLLEWAAPEVMAQVMFFIY